jgi:hypothetical protein
LRHEEVGRGVGLLHHLLLVASRARVVLVLARVVVVMVLRRVIVIVRRRWRRR